jgi:hypothetical protein
MKLTKQLMRGVRRTGQRVKGARVTDYPADGLPPITASYPVTPRVLRSAQFAVLRRPLAGVYALLLFSSCVVVLPGLLNGRVAFTDVRIWAIYGTFLVFLPAVLWWQPIKHVRGLKPGQRMRRFTFDSGGFTNADDLASTRVSWSAVLRVREAGGQILLFVQPFVAHHVPIGARRTLRLSCEGTLVKNVLRGSGGSRLTLHNECSALS